MQGPKFRIERLDVSNCYLTDNGKDISGAIELCTAVGENNTLHYLSLASNAMLVQGYSTKCVLVVYDGCVALRCCALSRLVSWDGLSSQNLMACGVRVFAWPQASQL